MAIKQQSFDKDFLRDRKLILKQKKAECLKNRNMARDNLVDATEVVGGNDDPNILHDQVVTIHNLDTSQNILMAIINALNAIERKEYGTCVDCEEMISKKRLMAVAWAQRCTSCQESFDSKEKLYDKSMAIRSYRFILKIACADERFATQALINDGRRRTKLYVS